MRVRALIVAFTSLGMPACAADDDQDGSSDSTGVADGSNTDDSSTEPTTLTASETEPTGEPTTAGSMSMSSADADTGTATTASGCTDSSECVDAATPVCIDMQCVACTDAADGDAECAAKDTNYPACREDGQCVQCTSSNAEECGDTTPVCDDGTSSCVGCTYHEQCESTACDIVSGACFQDCVVHVDGDGGQDFDNIGDGVEAAIAGGCVLVVHERDAQVPYTEPVVIESDTVAIFAAPGEAPLWEGTGGNPTLTISASSSVYLNGMWLVGNPGTGVVVTSDAYADLRNCFVAGNGNQFQDHHGITVSGATLHVAYSSVVANDGNGADSIECTDAEGSVRDSILMGADASSIDCTGVTFEANAVDEALAGNEDVSPLDPAWFASLPTDVHLTKMGEVEFAGIAEWNVGDPTTDIDGQARARVDGAPEPAGADLP